MLERNIECSSSSNSRSTDRKHVATIYQRSTGKEREITERGVKERERQIEREIMETRNI